MGEHVPRWRDNAPIAARHRLPHAQTSCPRRRRIFGATALAGQGVFLSLHPFFPYVTPHSSSMSPASFFCVASSTSSSLRTSHASSRREDLSSSTGKSHTSLTHPILSLTRPILPIDHTPCPLYTTRSFLANAGGNSHAQFPPHAVS